jgi:transketolase
VVNMPTIKPIDSKLLSACAVETGAIVTAEDHNIHGGLGGAVAESLAATMPCPVEFVGVKDTFGASGEPEELAHHFAISAPFIADAARRVVHRKRAFGAGRANK